MNDYTLQQHAERLEHSVWQAVIDKNGEALKSLFADDYLEVTLNGKRVRKGKIVKESPETDEITAYDLDQTEAFLLSDDTLLISYHVVIDGTHKGETIEPRERWATSIWRNRNGSWKCCFFQQSNFASGESSAYNRQVWGKGHFK